MDPLVYLVIEYTYLFLISLQKDKIWAFKNKYHMYEKFIFEYRFQTGSNFLATDSTVQKIIIY